MNNLQLAKTELLENELSVVVVKEDKIVSKSDKKGLMPLLDIYNSDKSILKEASVADKVIGKAAALILIDCGVKELYAHLISDAAIEILEPSQINFSYKDRVKEIRNRDNTGTCPMEMLAKDSTSAKELVKKIEEKFNK